jgi:hypothetical protein
MKERKKRESLSLSSRASGLTRHGPFGVYILIANLRHNINNGLRTLLLVLVSSLTSRSHRPFALGYFAKLPRSNSSPSPPSARNASGRADSSRRQFLSSRPAKRHLGPFGATVTAVQPDHTNMELSSTYHAGSSR